MFADAIQHLCGANLGRDSERSQQQGVAHRVDQARNPSGTHMYVSHKFLGKDRLVRHAGALQAELDVFHGVAEGESLQVRMQRNPLCQCVKIGCV